MKLVVGLGNPGSDYKDTRHNIGFMVLDALAKKLGIKFKIDRRTICLRADTALGHTKLLLCKPLSFMNLSGEAVKRLAKGHRVKPQDILVIYDDIDLDMGRMRIREKGGAGGHKGAASIIEELNTDGFARIRMGIASGGYARGKLSDYVLSGFSNSQKKIIDVMIPNAVDAVLVWLEQGIEKAMNVFNAQKEQNDGKL